MNSSGAGGLAMGVFSENYQLLPKQYRWSRIVVIANRGNERKSSITVYFHFHYHSDE
jgi:hypothetical protein